MKGRELWDIREVSRAWAQPVGELAFGRRDQRVLPEVYQAGELRALDKCLFVQDNLMSEAEHVELYEALQGLRGTSLSTRFRRDGLAAFDPETSAGSPGAPAEAVARLQAAKRAVVNRVWHETYAFLLHEPQRTSHVDAWINTGPLHHGQAGRYHFTHYDCDEYLEFSKGLYRFPAFAAVYYVFVDPAIDGGKLWFPELEQAVTPRSNRVAIFDARYAHSVLPAAAPQRVFRAAMTMNVWDYETRNERIELESGVLGYTENRREELQWRD